MTATRRTRRARVLLAPVGALLVTGGLTACNADDLLPSAQEGSGATSPSPSPSDTPTPTPTDTSDASATAAPRPSPAPTSSATPSGSAPSTASPEPSATGPAQAYRVGSDGIIDYRVGDRDGVELARRSDLVRLGPASQGLKDYLGGVLHDLQPQAEMCPDAFVGVSVEMVRPDDLAMGAVSECGGYRAIWAKVDGSWTEVAGTQDAWECSVLREHSVPSRFAGNTCLDGQQEKAYHQV